MIDDIKKDAEVSMAKAIEALNNACGQIRAGRPNPSMLDQIEADYFDAKTPLKQLANITITDASTISLNIWDKTAIKAIEKAILNSNLGLSPVINGMVSLAKSLGVEFYVDSPVKKIIVEKGKASGVIINRIKRYG